MNEFEKKNCQMKTQLKSVEFEITCTNNYQLCEKQCINCKYFKWSMYSLPCRECFLTKSLPNFENDALLTVSEMFWMFLLFMIFIAGFWLAAKG